MKPVYFEGHNLVMAKDQPEYLPLPVHRDRRGIVTTCWQMSIWEGIKVAFTGRIWLQVHTFNSPLQPLMIRVDRPEVGDGPPYPRPDAAPTAQKKVVDPRGGGRFG